MLEFRVMKVFEDGDRIHTLRHVKIFNNDIITLGDDTYVHVEYSQYPADRFLDNNRVRHRSSNNNGNNLNNNANNNNDDNERNENNINRCTRFINTRYILSCE